MKNTLRNFLSLTALTLSFGLSAQATQQTWTGTTTGTWATATNWSSGTAPVNSLTTDTVLFDSVTYAHQPNVASATSITGITIGDGTTATGALTITETAALSLGASGITINAASGATTFTGSTLIGASQTWTNNSSNLLTLGTVSNISNVTPFTLTVAGSGSGGTTFGGIISDSGTLGTLALVVNTTNGTTTLSAANTFTGGLSIQSGTVKVGGTNSVGAGTVTLGNTGTSGTLDLNGQTETIIGLATAGTASSQVIGNSSTTANAVLSYTGSTTSTYGGVIQNVLGSGTKTTGVTVNNAAASLTLSGSNTYTGATSVLSGTLNLSGAIAGSSVTVNGATGSFNETGTATVSGSGAAFSLLAGTANLAGVNTYTGTTTISGGTLNLSGVSTGSAMVVNSATATFNETSTGSLSGANALALSAGAVNLAGSNTYTGATAVSGGTLTLSGTSSGSNITVSNSSTVFNETSAGSISGTNTLSVSNGFVTLAGKNTYTGLTAVTGGTLTLSGTDNGSSITVSNAAGTFNETSAGLITGGGTLTVSAGTATLAASNSYSGLTTVSGGTLNLNNSNTTSGGVKLTSGTLTIGNAGALGSGVFTVTGGTFDNTSGGTMTLAGISSQSWGGSFIFTGSNSLDLGATNVTMTANSTANVVANTLTEDGAIGGAFTLTKTGTGTLYLTGNSGYTGATTVSSGLLQVTGINGSISSSASYTINTGGTLMLDDRSSSSSPPARLSSGAITLGNRATLLFEGADDPSLIGNSGQSVGTITPSGIGLISAVSNSSLYGTKLTATGITHTATTGGIALINGTNLGVANSTGTVSEVFAGSPTTVGTTAGGTTGINSSVKNTKIVPYLLGESGTASGQNSTLTGTANTFLTYNTTTGFRPLNPTDEFTGVVSGTVTTGNNIYIKTNSALTSSGTINSLVINGGDLSISSTSTLTNSSGALLFVTSNSVKPATTSGGLVFGNSEGIVTTDAGVNASISANISGTGSLTVYGGLNSSLTLSGSNSYSGNTGIGTGATLMLGSNNALGTGSIAVSSGGIIQADNQARTINNTFSVSGGGGAGTGIGGSNNVTLAGATTTGIAATLNANSQAEFTFANTATTTITGTFSLYNNSSSSYNNNGEGVTVGTSSNLVITGPITDNNSGNVPSGAGSVLTLTYRGTGANITLNPTLANNGYGGTFANGFSVVGFGLGYNTFTLGGPGGAGATITPFGLTNYTNNGAGSFLVAANNGQIIANNWVDGGSVNNFTFSLGFAGTNSITLSGTFQNPSTFLNIADPSATLTFAGVQSWGNYSVFNLAGPGNTTYSATSTLTGTSISKVGSGILTISGTNNMTGINTFSGGTLILDYSTNNNNKLAQITTATGTAVNLSGVNVQLNGGSYAQTPGAGNGTTLANSGQSSITQTGGGTSTLALGVLARAANGGSALNIGGTGTFVSTTSTGVNGILGGYATVGGADWAVGGGNITALPLASYGSFAIAGTGTARNILQTDGASVTGTTVNSLKITTTTTGQQLTISSGALALSTGGLLFTGSNDYTITGGTLQATSSTTDLIVQQYATGVLTISSVIGGGTNALTKAGPGTLILSGTNTYTGTTFVDQGILKISADNNLGSGGSITLNGGTLDVTTSGYSTTRTVALGANGGTLEVDAGTLTMSGVFSGGLGAGALSKTGSGTLVLSGVNTILVPVTVTAGTLQLGNASALGASSTNSNRSAAPILVNGGTLDINGQVTALGNITLSSGNLSDSVGTGSLTGYSFNLQSGTVGAALIDDAITGAQGTSIDLYKTTSGTVVLTGANTYSGATQIAAGTLQIGNGSGTGSLGSANVTMSGGSLVFDRNNTYTVANAISGAGAISQIGSGLLVLNGVNTYSGATSITTGTISVASTSNIGSGAINLATGGKLLYTGSTTGTLGQNISVTSGTGILSNTGASTLTIAGTVTKANSVLVFSGGNFDVTGKITGGTSADFNSDLTVNGGATVTLDNSSDDYTGPTNINGGGTLKDGVGTAPAGTVINLGSTLDGTVTNTFDVNGNNQTVAAINSTTNAGSTNVNTITNSAAGSGTSRADSLSGTNSDGVVSNSTYGGSITDGATAHTRRLAITGGTHAL